jgi:lipid-binding SYLF domain-containing protein
LAVQPHLNNPFTVTLRSAIRNATYTLMEQADPMLIPDQQIPSKILKEAQGFLFLTFMRLGFLGGARFGSGLAVVKRQDGTWSAPSAVGMGGLSIGFMAGADCVNLCLVMNSRRVCEVLASRGQVSFDGELGASIGPIGRNASVGLNVGNEMTIAPVYSYCQSRGLFAGIDLNGSLIITRKKANQKFYGVRHQTCDILSDVPQPEAAMPLYEALNKVTGAVVSDNTRELTPQQQDNTRFRGISETIPGRNEIVV